MWRNRLHSEQRQTRPKSYARLVVTIPNEKLPLLIQALEHFGAYLRVTNRNAQPYIELAEGLKRKGPEKEEAKLKARKRA